jgi:four helix bundle protein
MNKEKEEPRKRDINNRTFSFACRTVKLYRHLAKQKYAAEVLGRQVLRSGTAIGANLEEAQAGQSKADFVSKCNIALKEARETHYWLRLLRDARIISAEKINNLLDEANEIVAILTSIVKKTRASG